MFFRERDYFLARRRWPEWRPRGSFIWCKTRIGHVLLWAGPLGGRYATWGLTKAACRRHMEREAARWTRTLRRRGTLP